MGQLDGRSSKRARRACECPAQRGPPDRTAQGFVDEVKVGAFDLAKVAQQAASFPAINAPTYPTELTPIGEQLCIPAVNASPSLATVN
jgi:hypothetical protein